MKCVECGSSISDNNRGTDENPLCPDCYNRMAAQFSSDDEKSPAAGMKLNGIVRKAGVIALALAVFFGVKHFNKTRAGSAVEEGMELLLEKMPGYSENSEWYDGLFKDCYASSFDASYDIGSRRRAGRLKEREFLSSVFGCMEKKALSQGRPEEAATIQQMGKFTQAFIDEQK